MWLLSRLFVFDDYAKRNVDLLPPCFQILSLVNLTCTIRSCTNIALLLWLVNFTCQNFGYLIWFIMRKHNVQQNTSNLQFVPRSAKMVLLFAPPSCYNPILTTLKRVLLTLFTFGITNWKKIWFYGFIWSDNDMIPGATIGCTTTWSSTIQNQKDF